MKVIFCRKKANFRLELILCTAPQKGCTNTKKSFLYRRCIPVSLTGCESTAVYNPQSIHFSFLSSVLNSFF